MSRNLEARVSRLEQAAESGQRAEIVLWDTPGSPGPDRVEIERLKAAKAAEAGVPMANVDVIRVRWLAEQSLAAAPGRGNAGI